MTTRAATQPAPLNRGGLKKKKLDPLAHVFSETPEKPQAANELAHLDEAPKKAEKAAKAAKKAAEDDDTERMTITVSKDCARMARDVSMQVFARTIGDFFEDALRAHVAKLEEERGQPFMNLSEMGVGPRAGRPRKR